MLYKTFLQDIILLLNYLEYQLYSAGEIFPLYLPPGGKIKGIYSLAEIVE